MKLQDDYKAQVDNLTREISIALKQEIGENTNNHSNHLKKKVNGLKKKVDEYFEETQVIRTSYQKQNQILNQLQEKVIFLNKEAWINPIYLITSYGTEIIIFHFLFPDFSI